MNYPLYRPLTIDDLHNPNPYKLPKDFGRQCAKKALKEFREGLIKSFEEEYERKQKKKEKSK